MRILPWFLAVPALVAQAPAALPEAPMSQGERDQVNRLLASGHTARHTLQIEEVKRSPGYPAADH